MVLITKSFDPSGKDALGRFNAEAGTEPNTKLYMDQKGELKAVRDDNSGSQMSKTIVKAYEGGL